MGFLSGFLSLGFDDWDIDYGLFILIVLESLVSPFSFDGSLFTSCLWCCTGLYGGHICVS